MGRPGLLIGSGLNFNRIKVFHFAEMNGGYFRYCYFCGVTNDY